MVNLVVTSYPDLKVDQLVEQVLSEVTEIDVFLVTLHTGKPQVAVGEREYMIKGKELSKEIQEDSSRLREKVVRG